MSARFMVDGIRTPFGRFGGALANVRPDDLAAHTLRVLLDRAVGRMAVLLAGRRPGRRRPARILPWWR